MATRRDGQHYDAIARRDYERAYRYWGGSGSARAQSFEAFARGFAETASVEGRR